MSEPSDGLDLALRRVEQAEYESLEAQVRAHGEAIKALSEAVREWARLMEERMRHLEDGNPEGGNPHHPTARY